MNIIIPEKILYDKKLSPGSKLLYGVIKSQIDFNSCCNLTNLEFSKLFNVDPTTISRWVSQLSRNNYIISKNEYIENSNCIERRYLYLYSDDTDISKLDSNTTTFLYLLEDNNNFIKIGISKRPKSRCNDYKNRDARLIYYCNVDNAQSLEKYIHNKYNKYRIDKRSEWFDFKKKRKKIINEIKAIVDENKIVYTQ